MRRIRDAALLALLTLALTLAAARPWAGDGGVDYALAANWAYRETEAPADKTADVFFVCPTVYGGQAGEYNMPLTDREAMADFLGATNMEKGIYDDACRFFAPYYRQAGLAVYAMETEAEREPYLALAYRDVAAAFDYYLQHLNQGRPIVLAGFSQGADLCLRLMEDRFAQAELQDRLVACYAIGWRVTPEDLATFPHLRMAQGERDTGVIVSFNSEAPEVNASLLIPQGVETLAINPLNWRADGVPAGKDQNLGACFPDYSGQFSQEIPGLTGAYLDLPRGALKVPDVTPEDYPPVLDIFQPGVYHLYDYQFFYRNLEHNVQTRLTAFGA